MNVRILLVDDHEILRSGLRALLRGENGLEVVGEANDGRSAVRMVAELSPDVVVMDLRMPDLNGIDATRQALAANGDVKVIALSANSDHRSVIEMLRAGARGFVTKAAAFEELVGAIHAVTNDTVYLSPSIASILVNNYVRGGDPEEKNAFAVLSGREREVLQLMAEGNSTKEIAGALHVSVKTVETHRRSLKLKLDVESVAEATKYALREGLTSL